MKVISSLLLLTSIYLSFRHGWAGLTQNFKPAEAQLLADLGMSKPLMYVVSVASLATVLLLVFPPTNLLNAATVLLLMGLALNVGNLRLAALEIPFLVLPLALIWLKHPLTR
jgi:hypothetical protein